MPRRAKLVLQASAVAVVALLVALLGWKVMQENEGRGLVAAVRDGETPQAPGFVLGRLDGEGSISLASLRGNAVVLNFWASWCLPCKDEAPLFQEAWERYRDRDVVVLGVDAQDFSSDAKRFVARYGLTYPNVHDGEGSTLGRWGNTGFPETWFIDREGKIVEHIAGPVDAEQLEEGIQEALGT
jgi:cytochrome c biogenesis protein CcmG, thiol:disulfide interchange protein DsbE